MNKLGQNFLVNRGIAEKIIDCIELRAENILEIGGGKGALTEKIIKRFPNNKLYIIEIDVSLCEFLKKKFKNNAEIICKDILSVNYLPEKRFTLVSNLPYYISTEIIEWVIMNKKNIINGILMLQNDFVEKLLSLKTPLSLLFNSFYSAKKIFYVNRGSFSPMPKVKSVVFKFRKNNSFKIDDTEIFYDFLKKSFKNKRKTLLNNLLKYYERDKIIEFLNLNRKNTKIRAEDVGLENFQKLYMYLEKEKNI